MWLGGDSRPVRVNDLSVINIQLLWMLNLYTLTEFHDTWNIGVIEKHDVLIENFQTNLDSKHQMAAIRILIINYYLLWMIQLLLISNCILARIILFL